MSILPTSRFPRSNLRSIAFPLATAIIVLPITGAWYSRAAEKTIHWQLNEGDLLRVRITQRTRTEMQIGEQPTSLSMLTAMEMHWHVRRVDDDGAMHITQAFKRLILQSTEADGEPTEYDSASNEPPPQQLQEIAATIRPLLNSRFQVTLGPRGEIQAVQASGETESLLNDIPAYARWKKLLTRDGIDQTLRQCLGLMPEGPVQPGDSWNEMHEIETPSGRITMVNTFEYQGSKEVEGRWLEVVQMSTETRRAKQRGAFDELPKRAQRYTGTFHFDTAVGRLVQSRLRQEIKSEVPFENRRIQVCTSSSLDTQIDLLAD